MFVLLDIRLMIKPLYLLQRILCSHAVVPEMSALKNSSRHIDLMKIHAFLVKLYKIIQN